MRVDEEAQSLNHSGRVQNDFQSKTGCCLHSVNSDGCPYCIEVESTTEITKRERAESTANKNPTSRHRAINKAKNDTDFVCVTIRMSDISLCVLPFICQTYHCVCCHSYVRHITVIYVCDHSHVRHIRVMSSSRRELHSTDSKSCIPLTMRTAFH